MKQTDKTHRLYKKIKKNKDVLSIYEHSSGVDVLYGIMDNNKIKLTAVSYDDNGKNISQIDCGEIKISKLIKMIKAIQ
jgi:hypothetical protein